MNSINIEFRFTEACKTQLANPDCTFKFDTQPILPCIGDVVLLQGLETYTFTVTHRFWAYGKDKTDIVLTLDFRSRDKSMPVLHEV